MYDLATDPGQDKPIRDPAQEQRMLALMARLMAENDAPPEAFRRLEMAEPA